MRLGTSKMLVAAGLTVGDIGQVHGVSHQRVAQLLAGPMPADVKIYRRKG